VPSFDRAFPASNSKPFCVGIKITPWEIPYNGKCRYGSALGPMQATMPLLNLDYRRLQQQLHIREYPETRRQFLLNDVTRFQRLTPAQGRSRLHREAKKGSSKHSWPRTAAASTRGASVPRSTARSSGRWQPA